MSSKESEMKMGKKKEEKKFTFIDLFAGCGGVRVSIRLAEDAKLV